MRVTEYQDDFTQRLLQVNHGLIRKGNIAALKLALELAPPSGAVLEIGTFTGTTACLIAYFAEQGGKTREIYTCDRWDYGFKGLSERPLGHGHITGNQWGEHARETALSHIRFFAGTRHVHPMLMWSAELLSAWQESLEVSDLFGNNLRLGRAVAFAFIDGNHGYDFVKADFKAVDKVMMPGGVVLFDDSADLTGSPGVRRFMKELKSGPLADGRYSLISKASNYLIRKDTVRINPRRGAPPASAARHTAED